MRLAAALQVSDDDLTLVANWVSAYLLIPVGNPLPLTAVELREIISRAI
jgi:hypothetical protein